MKIVCFGDSLTAYGHEGSRFPEILQDRFPEHKFLNKGESGNTFEDALKRFPEDVLDEKPDILIICLGACDWWQAKGSPSAWADNLEFILQTCGKLNIKVILAGIFGKCLNLNGEYVEKIYGFDARAAEYHLLEKALAEKYHCFYVSNIQQDIIYKRHCWSDNNHHNEMGNRYVADLLSPQLERLLKSSEKPLRKPLSFLYESWQEAVEMSPHKIAVIYEDKRLSFLEANYEIERLSSGLKNVTRVAVYLQNSLEYFFLYWAVLRNGGTLIPLNTWLKKKDLQRILENTKTDLLIVQNEKNEEVLHAAKYCQNLSVFSLDECKNIASFSELFLDDIAEPAFQNSKEPLLIMHTSGTTSTPKGAVMYNEDILFNISNSINAHEFTFDDRHLLVNPMFHCTALYSQLPVAAFQKTPLVITHETQPDKILALIDKEQITTVLSVPSNFQRMITCPNVKKFHLTSLRLFAFAGSPMPVFAIQALKKWLPHVALHNFFGMTETISATHVSRTEDLEKYPDSIGTLLSKVEAVIIDENNHEVSVGKEGELLISRDCLIREYFQNPTLDVSIIELNGSLWFKTGDRAVVNKEGFYFLRGRSKDVIIVGGENVYALEVENVLLQHKNILEAAVIALPAKGVRESLGELIKAVIVTDCELDEMLIRKFCYEYLPVYKIPHIVEFRDELPRNPAGKIIKSELNK